MSLQIWLPLNGNLENKGLSDLTIVNNGAVIDNKGKIGKCYKFDGSSARISCSEKVWEYPISISGWFKPTNFNSTSTQYWFSYNTDSGGIAGHATGIGTLEGMFAVFYCGKVATIPTDIINNNWYHVAVTISANKKATVYLNGIQIWNSIFTGNKPNSKWVTLGARSNSATGGAGDAAYYFAGYMNDIRLYDHVLSLKQIKELSKGLILHYKLDENISQNLIRNGFGQLGSQNWDATKLVTTDTPSENPSIKASIKGSTYCYDFIPINNLCTYKFQVWLKNISTSSSGNMYPSIALYDIDKKFISYCQSPQGFNINTMTQLKEDLKAGDTKIYVNDLSTWTTAKNYYNIAAIFGYQDSTGYIYPDGTYTRNTLSFWSGNTTEKQNLDKINNIITLNAAYAGKTVPAGTSICQSTDGATFYYPVGAVARSTATNWIYKTSVFKGDHPRLQMAKYIKYYVYAPSDLNAGIKIVNLTTQSNFISDSSGYQNNGTIVENLQTINDSPKYTAAVSFNGASAINCISPTAEAKTVSLWVKWDSIPTGQSVVFLDYKSKLGLGLMSTGILCGTSGPGSYYTFSKTNLIANTWYHFVVINPDESTSVNRKLYINGIEQEQTSQLSNWTYNIDQTQIGKRSTTSDGLIGKISDIRLYATVLSLEDIKELYQTSTMIDRDQNLYVRELIEI